MKGHVAGEQIERQRPVPILRMIGDEEPTFGVPDAANSGSMPHQELSQDLEVDTNEALGQLLEGSVRSTTWNGRSEHAWYDVFSDVRRCLCAGEEASL